MVASTPQVPTGDAAGPPAPPGEGEATLLVSEFPPPPFYYRQAATLTPPPIPLEALERGTKRAAAAAEKARAEAERLRLEEGIGQDVITGQVAATQEEDGEVVGVFGEVVEDPLLFQPLDRCEDPRIVRDEVKRLNKEVVKGFVKLVQDLVHRPTENKKARDELSHNVFLMLQECNKFREHQARETLIAMLESQLDGRRKLVQELKEGIAEAEELLDQKQTDEGL